MRKHHKHAVGFTLIELMIVVSLIGIIAMTALPSILDYIADAKTVEARINLKRIGDGAIAFFETEHVYGNGMKVIYHEYPTKDNEARKKMLGYKSYANKENGKYPSDAIGKMPYKREFGQRSNPDLWQESFNQIPWIDLNFRLTSPFLYSYNYQSGAATYDGKKNINGASVTSKDRGNTMFAATAHGCIRKSCTEWDKKAKDYVNNKHGKCDSGYVIVGGRNGTVSVVIDDSDFKIEPDCGKAMLQHIFGNLKGKGVLERL